MIFTNIVVFFTNYSKEVIITRYDEKRLDYQFVKGINQKIKTDELVKRVADISYSLEFLNDSKKIIVSANKK